MNRACVYITTLFLFLSGAVYFWSRQTEVDISDQPSVKRQVSFSLALTNNGGGPIAKAEFWVYGPNKKSGVQVCQTIKADHPFEASVGGANNQLLHFEFENLPPYAKKIINVEAALAMQPLPLEQSSEETNAYLGKEQFVEINDRRLIKKAAGLTAANTLNTIEKTYEYVSSAIGKSPYSGKPKGALYTLLNKKGDCTEFMHLFIALCRLNNIPTRGVSGYLINRDQRLNPDEMHDWPEVYLEGRWRVVDPYFKNFMAKEDQYLIMRIHSSPQGPDNFQRWRTSSPKLSLAMLE